MMRPVSRAHGVIQAKMGIHNDARMIIMALSDTKLRNLKPAGKAYQEADGGRLFVEVMPGGAVAVSLPVGWARQQAGKGHAGQLSHLFPGRGPGDPIPHDAPSAAKELAQALIVDIQIQDGRGKVIIGPFGPVCVLRTGRKAYQSAA
jgi:hypothetical protein